MSDLIKLLPLPEPPENLLNIPPDAKAELEAAYAEVIKARDELLELLRPAIQAFADALTPIIKELAAYLPSFIEATVDVLGKIINLYPNKRVIYLATHGKPRTRKKNMKRILKYFEREGKERAVFAQN